jgi:hypothetical protein
MFGHKFGIGDYPPNVAIGDDAAGVEQDGAVGQCGGRGIKINLENNLERPGDLLDLVALI